MSGVSVRPEKRNRFLDWIERVGNKMPHPLALFTYIIGIVLLLSLIFGLLGTSAVHPTNGETIVVRNLISLDGLALFMQNFVRNFQNFPVLGIVIIMGIVTGVCDKTGFFSVAIRMGLRNVKGNAIVFVVALIGVFSNQFHDSAFILVPILTGAVFQGVGRHPLAGVFLGYATVGGGYSTALLPSAWDVALTPVTITAAQGLDPSFDMNPLSGYLFLFVAAWLCAVAATIVTIKVIEPMLGTYDGEVVAVYDEVTPEAARAAKRALRNLAVFLLLLAVACVPQSSFLRNPKTGSLLYGSTFAASIQFFLVAVFAVLGFSYAIYTGKVRTAAHAAEYMGEGVKTMSGFIVLAVVIAQFMFLFDKSNLGQVMAIRVGQLLAVFDLPSQVIVVLFLLMVALVNIFIASGNTKWMLMGPIFVPIMMQLDIHPSLTQALYRLGDCGTNHLTPLWAYFAILLTTVQKYDRKAGMGTLFSAMLPYSGAFLLVYAIEAVVWVTLNLPVGVGGQVFLR